ncbi:MAG: hypothetical protein M0016_04260 [Deltaproteobacteria bacterium]|jgi:soluble cytochrome b562|nr:hypothetical protein [Deltaproteobacteria bacterium]MCL5879962.1 hypothetical protein [Deltaproteobacteria bacterium]MDA8304363.1 hypothetical protein [Deltaproteobacteria bacterium]
MADFFKNIEDVSKKKELADMVQEITEMKVAIDDIKEAYEVKDEKQLLNKIKKGLVPEHPAYEGYLSILHIRDYIAHYRLKIQNLMDEL